MPSATEELRNLWHGPREWYAIDFLERRGYKLRRDFFWDPPDREPTHDENSAINFLFYEWDFGGIVEKESA